MHRIASCVLVLVALVLASCEHAPFLIEGSGLVQEDDLRFVRVSEAAPPLLEPEVSFWAVRGQTRQVQILYDGNGYGSGLCLEFTVPAGALLRGPDGTAYSEGDSVLITIRVLDLERYDFEFQPAGLVFDPQNPAQLKVAYDWADPDFDGDGVVSEAEQAQWQRFGFWRQETATGPWERILTMRDDGSAEAIAAVPGFTRYALASD